MIVFGCGGYCCCLMELLSKFSAAVLSSICFLGADASSVVISSSWLWAVLLGSIMFFPFFVSKASVFLITVIWFCVRYFELLWWGYILSDWFDVLDSLHALEYGVDDLFGLIIEALLEFVERCSVCRQFYQPCIYSFRYFHSLEHWWRTLLVYER